jgi:hypothetical protein
MRHVAATVCCVELLQESRVYKEMKKTLGWTVAAQDSQAVLNSFCFRQPTEGSRRALRLAVSEARDEGFELRSPEPCGTAAARIAK